MDSGLDLAHRPLFANLCSKPSVVPHCLPSKILCYLSFPNLPFQTIAFYLSEILTNLHILFCFHVLYSARMPLLFSIYQYPQMFIFLLGCFYWSQIYIYLYISLPHLILNFWKLVITSHSSLLTSEHPTKEFEHRCCAEYIREHVRFSLLKLLEL